MNHKLADHVTAIFQNNFGHKPQKLIYSPGRINLIGEHVDYNGGFVMPAAIDKAIYIALSPSDSESSVYAEDIDAHLKFEVATATPSSKTWENYVLGVVDELKKLSGFRQNFNAVFSGDIPVGSGLSSSAALDCGFAFGLNEMFNLKVSRKELSLLAQRAEHNFVGIKCGIMDQFSSLMGKENQFLYLDTRSLDHEYFRFDLGDYRIQLYNSNVSHKLADSSYNKRRQQCENIVNQLAKLHPYVKSLRDCTHEMLYSIKEHVDSDDYQKAKFVVDEILRVQATTKAIKTGDISAVGQLLNETHKGLRDEYEVSCKEVDFIQSETLAQKGVLGGRIMGGGFGGCTINIIHKNDVERVTAHLTTVYKKQFDKELLPFSVNISHGTSCIY